MRPIKLKIKGLNSFIEEQTIDFEKLTSQGFFGIFGPTGSGKSTILDGITLALYGEVARKSSNYINTNCKTMSVSFQFQISGATPKKYLVERDFKRALNKDRNTYCVRTSGAKLVDVSGEKAEILEDSVFGVTKRCQEIIGLSLDDFTRTVLLPQGKFSEFLKLEGKDRREMLERLFSLQKYGDLLTFKLSRESNIKKSERDVILGQLIGSEELNPELLKEKQGLLKLEEKKLRDLCVTQKVMEKKYRESEELWKLQVERLGTIEKESQLLMKKSEIDIDRIKLVKSEGAAKVLPLINDFEATKAEMDIVSLELGNLIVQEAQLKEEKHDSAKKLDQAKLRKNSEYSKLELKRSKIKEAIIEKQQLKNLENEIDELGKSKQELEAKIKFLNTDFIRTENEIENENKTIKLEEEQKDALRVEESFKEMVQEGLILSGKFEIESKKSELDHFKLKKTQDTVDKEENNAFEVRIASSKIVVELEQQIIALDIHLKDFPGDEKDLLKFQTRITENKEKWNKFNLLEKTEQDCTNRINFLGIEHGKYLLERADMENSLNKLRTEFNRYELQNIVMKLSGNLLPGETCPVCGSLEHHLENLPRIKMHEELVEESQRDLAEDRSVLGKLEGRLKLIDAQITKAETQLDGETKVLLDTRNQLALLGEEFKNVKTEELEQEFNVFSIKLSGFWVKKESLEKKISLLKDEKADTQSSLAKATAVIDENKKQVEVMTLEINEQKEVLEKTKHLLGLLIEETSVTDFKKKNDEIRANEADREKLGSSIKARRINLEKITKAQMKSQKILAKSNQELVKIETFVIEKTKIALEKNKAIIDKAGTLDNLDDVLNNIETLLRDIDGALTLADEVNGQVEKKLQAVGERTISLKGKKDEIEKQITKTSSNLTSALLKEKFNSIEDARISYISDEIKHSMLLTVNGFDEAIIKIKGSLESLAMKIGNRFLNGEDWQSIQTQQTAVQEEIEILSEARIKLSEEVKAMKERLDLKKELIEQKAKIDRKLALLGDLEKLFKGKKFVEYVATTQLKYISMEGSKRLKEITSGGFGLEVDENSKFIIRDYKNGGAGRDASTLSGGETFLASLALALALSAQIQLKGAAPLELFFLDEGFGTLDDDLLEVVMSSLERIHHEKLKVGIISHLGTIKDRVPLKLMITPAVAGCGGSKVQIE